MRIAHQTPALTLAAVPARDLVSDLLIVPVFEEETPLGDDLAEACGEEYAAAHARGEFRGRPFEQLPVSPGGMWRGRRALLVGVGRPAALTTDRVRRIATIGGLAARQRRLTRISLIWRTSDVLSAERIVQALAEGVVLANFEAASHKTTDTATVWLESAQLQVPQSMALAEALERGRVLGEYSNVARELANEPGNLMTPTDFAGRAAAIASAAGLAVEILDEPEIARLGMGMLLGVARGSTEPPRVVVLRHEPTNAAPGVVLGLVGKGITFDSGGISIKPADGMDRMKDDMSGGAAVLCAMAALSRLGASVRCLGVIPLTENMPSGRALKPGDILTSAEGKTVEVLNTDAEGRLILGDALWYARKLGATHLVDVATLTGACVVALGKTTSGLFGTPDWWVDQVRKASDRAGDRAWPMPVFEDYFELLKSDVADFGNTGGRAGGAIVAALFVKEFSGGLPWVHMDIAGTAWAEDAKPYQPKGATGVGVRTLAELALASESWNNLT